MKPLPDLARKNIGKLYRRKRSRLARILFPIVDGVSLPDPAKLIGYNQSPIDGRVVNAQMQGHNPSYLHTVAVDKNFEPRGYARADTNQ